MKQFAMASVLLMFGLLAGLGGAAGREASGPVEARATDLSAQTQYRRARPRIQINPGRRLLYRRCIGGYELQNRPSGTVLFPYRHCWWVRG